MRIHQRFSSRITVRDRGIIADGFRRAYNSASKAAWYHTGQFFHDTMRDERFTPEHAEKAKFYKRRGQNLPAHGKGVKRYYYWRKYHDPSKGGGANKANPLEFTGTTRRAVRAANIESTRYGAKVSYPGARAFNFRHPKSMINMTEEFTRLLPDEIRRLSDYYDAELDRLWKGQM